MLVTKPSVLQKKLRSGGASAVWLSLGSAAVAEMAAHTGPDSVVFDMQHGLWDRESLEAGIGLVAPFSLPLVRTAENSAVAVGQSLDAGAAGVIIPLIETAQQAAKAVSYSHYPPHGERSGGGVRPLLAGFGAYMEWTKNIVCAVMIETKLGLKNCAEIARTPGVDMVFIGTGDLAIALGGAPTLLEKACADILKQCRAADMPCGIFTKDVQDAANRLRQGYAFVTLASDITAVGQGFAAAVLQPDGRKKKQTKRT